MRLYFVFLHLILSNFSFAQCNTKIITDYNFTMCKSNSIQINCSAQCKNFQWLPAKNINDVTAISPIVTPDTTTTYFVTAVDANGCLNKDSITVNVINCDAPGQYVNLSTIDFGSGILFDTVYSPTSNGNNMIWPTTCRFSFSYAYPFNKQLNAICNGNSFPNIPSLQVKIILGTFNVGNFERQKSHPCANGPSWPSGCVDSDSLLFYPDMLIANNNNSMQWFNFVTSSTLQPQTSGSLAKRIQIINLTPTSPCGNDIVLDDIHFDQFISYQSFSFRLPYDTIRLCTKTSQTYTASDLVNADNVQFAWFKSLDKGKTWQSIYNPNTDRKTLTYASQQKEEWIRLEGYRSAVAFLPTQRFQSNYFIILSDAVFNAKAGNDTAICKGASLQLNATGGTYNLWSPPDYLSNTNTLNPLLTPATSIQYILQTSNDPNFAANCTSYDTINIRVDEKPIVVAGKNQTISQGDSTKMKDRKSVV